MGPAAAGPDKTVVHPLILSLNELAAFLNRGIAGAPRHDRHRRRRILRRTFDQLVGIDHIDQHVALGVAAANDLHFLEERRTALPEHIVALLHLALEMDRADLAACQRDIRNLLGKSEPALEAALLRSRRTALPEHIVALLHLALEMDRADLAACQRDIRNLLGKSEPALEAALL